MKICTNCGVVTAESAIQCPACTAVVFDIEATREVATPAGLLSWEFTFRYVAILFGGTFAIGFITSAVAHSIIAAGGDRFYAIGFIGAQSVLIPVAVFACFLWLASDTDRPFVRATSVFVWTAGVSVIVNVLIAKQNLDVFLSGTAVTFLAAVAGAFGGYRVGKRT